VLPLLFGRECAWARASFFDSDMSASARQCVAWFAFHLNRVKTLFASCVTCCNTMDCMTWRFWTMRQSNGCSTPAPRCICGQAVV